MARPDMTRVVFEYGSPDARNAGDVFERRMRVARTIEELVSLIDPDGDFVVSVKVNRRFSGDGDGVNAVTADDIRAIKKRYGV